MELNLVRLIFDVTPEASVSFTELVSGKSAAFEDAVRKVFCSRKELHCTSCPVDHTCPVTILTARKLSSNPEIVQQHQKPGLPYIFSRLHRDRADLSTFGLCLLGPATAQLSNILKALVILAGSTPCFTRMSALDYQGGEVPVVFSAHGEIEALPVLDVSELLTRSASLYSGCRKIQLVLTSPLRLMSARRELRSFDPVVFCCSVLRRVSSLFAYYGDDDVDHDLFRNLAYSAREITVVGSRQSISSLQLSVRGVTGCYELAGPFEQLGPFLSLGGLVHTGKQASYGLGAFEVAPIS